MGSLPVGNQQLVEIARVIFSGADTIILDEPTSALSPPETRRLFDFIKALKSQGKTLVFIGRFLEDVLATPDRIPGLKNSRNVATLATKDTTKRQMVELMIGNSPNLNALYEDSAHAVAKAHEQTGGDPRAAPDDVLSVSGVTKLGAFSDISFSVRRGEILGLFAFMGAGQPQLARCLFGAEPLHAGTVAIDKQPLRLGNTTRASAAGIAFVPEDRRFALSMQKEIFKNITVAHLRELVPFWLDEKAEIEIAKDQIRNTGMRPPNPLLPAGALSGGNQQKVVLAKWLTQRPRVLILCEPTRGMDVGAKEEVIAIVKRLSVEGVAILFVTTEPEGILRICNRSLVMRKGRITAELSGPELSHENLMSH